MKPIPLAILWLFFAFSCTNKEVKVIKSRIPLFCEKGIFIEEKDYLDSTFNYSRDNKVYTIGQAHYYTYVYISKNDSFRIKATTSIDEYGISGKDWDLVDMNDTSDSTIHFFKLTPKASTNPNSTYQQTIIEYKYLNSNFQKIPYGKSTTGCIENWRNIWLHPPRSYLFKILELNPFPFVQLRCEVGEKWNTQLNYIGHPWGDKRWAEWEGYIDTNSTYEIIDKKIINIAGKKMECYVIESEAHSVIGDTKLTSYFNDIEGFVLLAYENIDNSEIIISKIWK